MADKYNQINGLNRSKIRTSKTLESYSFTHFHPGRGGRVQSAVEGDGVVGVRAQGAGDVHDRHPQGAFLVFGGIDVAVDVQIGSFDVTVDEQGQVGRVDVPLEVALVDLDEVMVSFFRVLKCRQNCLISMKPFETTSLR